MIYFYTSVLMLLDLLSHVLTRKLCRQDQLGSIVLLQCPPPEAVTLSYCCDNNGKISCCSYDDYIHRVDGQSKEALTWLIITGSVALFLVIVLCYIRWHRNSLKPNSSIEKQEEQHDTKHSRHKSVVNALENGQHNLPPQMPAQKIMPLCRYGEVLKSILEEEPEKTSSKKPKKNISFS